MGNKKKFYKRNPNDKIWWVSDCDEKFQMQFSFDRTIVFDLFKDFPDALNQTQIKQFKEENSRLVEQLEKRQKLKRKYRKSI